MTRQITAITSKRMINCAGEIVDLSTPKVMGIINITPDSFYDGGNLISDKHVLQLAEKHIVNGALLLDIGAVSTKPNAENVSLEEERKRLLPAIKLLKKNFSNAIISVDTFRAEIAKEAISEGAHIINDVSGGSMDHEMFETIAKLKVPYILMHMRGTPQTMQQKTDYKNVTSDVFNSLQDKLFQMSQLHVKDVIIDLGFGFAKTVEQNYQLLRDMKRFEAFNCPILAGVSRKSMINRVLGTTPETALNGTSALHMLALQNGAAILRVHDAKEATECIKIHSFYQSA